MINFIKSKKILIIIVILIIGGAVIFVSAGEDTNKYDTVKVNSGDLVQLVSVTGNIEPAEEVDLAFDRSGIVSNVYFDSGDEVVAGEVIARLENSSLNSDLKESQANLEGEIARLSELQRGPTQYQINVKQSEVNETKQQLTNAYDSVDTVAIEAYSDAYDALKNKTADLFDGSLENYNYDLTFDVCQFDDKSRAENERLNIEFLIDEWRNDKNISDNASKEELLDHLGMTKNNLQEFDEFFSVVNDALESVCESDESIASDYRSSVSTAKNNILAALSEVKDLQQSISLKEQTLDKKEKELEELIAGASDEEIQAQQAAVSQAEARVENIRSQINKGIIRASFSGTVTNIDINKGETISAGTTVVSVISGSDFEIKTNIPEVDISKVKIGDKASITLDAFENDRSLDATVIQIDPSETIVEGITTYQTTLKFDKDYEGIRPGMTADIDVKTGEKENVLSVPKRAVVESDGREYVRVLTPENTIKEVDVETGLLGSSGNIEIIKGLNGGEKVVTFVRN